MYQVEKMKQKCSIDTYFFSPTYESIIADRFRWVWSMVMLFRHPAPRVERRYFFSRLRVENDRSHTHVEAGIVITIWQIRTSCGVASLKYLLWSACKKSITSWREADTNPIHLLNLSSTISQCRNQSCSNSSLFS